MFHIDSTFHFDLSYHLSTELKKILVMAVVAIFRRKFEKKYQVELEKLSYSFAVKLIKGPSQLNWLMSLFILSISDFALL